MPEASRIVGGELADKNSIPWQVRLTVVAVNSQSQVTVRGCGGTIICDRFVMTAGHCIYNPQKGLDVKAHQIKVLAEEHSRRDPFDHKEHTVKKINLHPKWRNPYQSGMPFDFAILELNEPIDLSDKAKAVCLPEASDAARIFKKGTKLVASGWGRQAGMAKPDKLQRVTLPWLPKSMCGGEPNNVMVCAGGFSGKSACKGDSGGTKHI